MSLSPAQQSMTSQPQNDPDNLLVRLVRYLHDCLAAQNQWASAVNVLRQKDVFLVPLTRRQQARFGQTGSLTLDSSEALELDDRPRYSLRLAPLPGEPKPLQRGCHPGTAPDGGCHFGRH
jgi:hypothetical protein